MPLEKKIIYALVCLGCFTISINVAAVAAAIPIISRDLFLSDYLVANIIPYYLLPYGIGALIYAPLTRFMTYRNVYIMTFALYGVSCYVCAISQSLEGLLCGRILMGITAAGAIPLGLMLIGDLYKREIRGRLVGVFFSNAFIASILGLIVVGFLDWRWVFYLPAGISLVLSLLFFIIPLPALSEKHEGHINYFKVLLNKEILRIFGFIFVLSFLYHGVHKWYGVYLSKVYAFDKLTISIYLIVTVVAGMLGQIIGGILTDKKSRVFTVYVGLIGLAVFIILLFKDYSKVVLGVILFLISMFWTIGHNGVSTILTDFASIDRPVVASLNSSVRFVSGALGFYVSSFFVVASFQKTFFVFGLIMFLLVFVINKTILDSRKI